MRSNKNRSRSLGVIKSGAGGGVWTVGACPGLCISPTAAMTGVPALSLDSDLPLPQGSRRTTAPGTLRPAPQGLLHRLGAAGGLLGLRV